MILLIIYAGAGFYLLLIASGLIHRQLLFSRDPYTRSTMRMAMSLFGLGLITLGLYYGYIYLSLRPALEEARRQDMQGQLDPGRPDPSQSRLTQPDPSQ